MPIPLEEHVRQLLLERDRGVQIYQAVVDGWSAFQERYPQRHQWRRKSSSRAMVWEEIVRRLAEICAADEGLVLVEHRDTISLVLEDEVLLRLKHADSSLITRNYPTEEAQAFDDHEVDLYGFAGLQRVKLCYVVDQFEQNLIWVGVMASKMGNFLWKIELNDVGAMPAPVTLPLEEPEIDTAKLAKLKKVDVDPKTKKNNGDK